MKLRPAHAAIIILLFAASVLIADLALDGSFQRSGYERVAPDANGRVVLEVADLAKEDVRFFRFLNTGNQEVKFFVGRDSAGQIQVAFDASDICYKYGRGFRHEGDWVTCNKCDKSFQLTTVNAGGGGCKPTPLAHRLDGERLVLQESDILAGWRYFR
jgi:uncharacterized membrane protein